MPDLAVLSGLPLGLSGDLLLFGEDVIVDETTQRLLADLALVALDPASCLDSAQVAYHMYNGIYRRSDARRLSGVPLRYELTLIPPRLLGREYVKTHGHLHDAPPGSALTYPEICEVLLGTAHIIMQTFDPAGPRADTVTCIEVAQGQTIVIPPGVDHLTINPGSGPLLFADVIALQCRSLYDRFRASHGAAYLEIEQNGSPTFFANSVYASVPPLTRRVAGGDSQLGLLPGETLYASFVRTRGQEWGFLTQPERRQWT